MINNKTIITSTLLATLLLSGCGSSSTTDSSSTGYLVDSAVANADYDCIADKDYNKTTGENGEFTCKDMSQVRFRLGNLVLGEVSVSKDGYVLPQDLVGVDRDSGINNEDVIAMAQLLQSIDKDANTTNGIQIDDESKDAFDINESFEATELDKYVSTVGVVSVDSYHAQEHLHNTMSHLNQHVNETNSSNSHSGMVDLSTYPLSNLTLELKDALAHMGNEERLAYDVYENLFKYHRDNGEYIIQLINIAQNSEINHIASVQALVQRYNLTPADTDVIDSTITEENNMSNQIAFEDMPSGVYDIPAIQDLYDTLYAKGIESKQDALEVGCMVEVRDVNDLDNYIALAQESNASDVEAVFTNLRAGSYNHYWSFDKGLKNMGIADGCCSIGDEWCHPEYPTKEKEHGSNGSHTRNGDGSGSFDSGKGDVDNHTNGSHTRNSDDSDSEKGDKHNHS
jgi:hypothetical protein